MSGVKKIIAAVLTVALCLSCMAALTSCRMKKDEVVMTYTNGDKTCEITAGEYLYFLLAGYSDFRSEYDESLEEESKTTAADFDYEDQKLDDTDYATWVKDRAAKYCAEYAYIATEFDRLGLELNETHQAYIENYASQGWTSYQEVYESNGVSYDTFEKLASEYQFKSSAVFDYYYGEHTDDEKKEDKNIGSLRPDDAAIKKNLEKYYQIADTLSVSLTKTDSSSSNVESLTDDEKKAEKAKLQAYADRLNNGESFATIYKEFNGSDVEDSESTDAAPKDKYATLFSHEDVASSSDDTPDYFDDVKKQTVGKAVVVEFADKLMLIDKQDISKDSYYFDQYKETVVSAMKGEEFEDSIEKNGQKLEVVKNESAIKYYAPKKIEIPTAASTASYSY